MDLCAEYEDEYDSPLDIEFYDYMYGNTCDQKLYESLKDLIDICSSTKFYSSIPILPITLNENLFRYAEMAAQYPYTYCSLVSNLCSMEDDFVYPIIELLVKHVQLPSNATYQYKTEFLEKIIIHACISGSSVLFDFVLNYRSNDGFDFSEWIQNIHLWHYLFCRREYMDDAMIEIIQKNRVQFANLYICHNHISLDSWYFWFSSLCRRGMYLLVKFVIDHSDADDHRFFELDKMFVYACNTGNQTLIDIYLRFNPCKYNIISSEIDLTTLGYPALGSGVLGGKEWVEDYDILDDFIIPIQKNSNMYGIIRSPCNERWERMRLFHIRNKYTMGCFIPNDVLGHISQFLY